MITIDPITLRSDKIFKTVAKTLTVIVDLSALDLTVASVTSVTGDLTIAGITHDDTTITFTAAAGVNNQEYPTLITFVDSNADTWEVYAIVTVSNDPLLDYYGTVQDADDYFDLYFQNNLEVYWNLMFPGPKLKALVQATRSIDTLRFSGDKTDPDQLLQFPRDDEPVPLNVQRATYEEALALSQGTTANDLMSEGIGIKREEIDTARVEYNNDIDMATYRGIVSQAAWRLLLPFLADNRSIPMIRIN